MRSIYLLFATTVLFLVLTRTPAKAQPLPDLTNPFAGLSNNSVPRDYAALAGELFAANHELRASELYLYSALLYCRGNKPDSAGTAMLAAIANGMANPNILDKDPALVKIKYSKHWLEIETQLRQIEAKQSKPGNFQVVTGSLPSFFAVHDRILEDQDSTCDAFNRFILDGSNAIRDFYVLRYKSVDHMCDVMVEGEPQHYNYLQSVYEAGKFDDIKSQTESMILRFSKRYPPGTYPDVYIVPGILNSGGTASNLGLYVGGEKFIKSDSMPSLNNNSYAEGVATVESMKNVIFHELMHFQQNYRDTVNTANVLAKVIQEGVCDFLVHLFSNQDISQVQSEYLAEPQTLNFVLTELQKDKHSTDLSRWMYNSGSEDWPSDLGYMLGAEICRAYYNRSADKEQAIYELLNTDDIAGIYEKAGYGWVLD